MIAALLLASAPVATALDVERAFAADAQRIGQWTAFRKYADYDAVMFTPQAVWVRDFLAGRKDPPRSVRWAAAHGFVSCDGRTAVNTGPWWAADGVHHGYFTTVWQRTSGSGWRWVYDGGGADPESSKTPARVMAQVHRASCRAKAPGAPIIPPAPLTPKQARTTPEDSGRGQSADKTLGWDWKVEKDGARKFRVYQWTGARYAQVIFNDIPAPSK
jgi:hypothetical protein